MVRGEVGVLRGEEGLGVLGELVMVRHVRGERLGAADGRLVIRLRLCGDVWLVRGVQVKLAHVNRMWRRVLTEERVQSLGLRRERGVGQRIWGEDWRSVGKVGVWHERRERRGKHVRVVRRWEVLGRVLLHVKSLPPGVLWRMHLRVHGRPGVCAASPFLLERVRPRVCRCASYRVCPCVTV